MKQAQAASLKVIVQTLHPDWDDIQIDEEVEAIQLEQGVVDPNTLGLSPNPPEFEEPDPESELPPVE